MRKYRPVLQYEFATLLGSLLGYLADPLTLIGSIAIGLASKRIKTTILAGSILGIILGLTHYLLAKQLYGESSIAEALIGQVLSCLILALVLQFLKRCYQKLNRIQDDMDECQMYFTTQQGASPPRDSSKQVSTVQRNSEPINGASRSSRSKAVTTNVSPKSLNLLQKKILGGMIPVLVVIGLNALASNVCDRPYQWNETWWVWIGGLGALTCFEVWFWQDHP